MKFTEQYKTIKSRVKFLLTNYSDTRDSDKLLWLSYMCVFYGLKNDIATGDYSTFKKLLMQDETPTFESLSRARRKLQENSKELRGKTYAIRKLEAINFSDYIKKD